ncbi:hypothetical protein E05_35410 [Plautia stali symbiont]|nr:hypothetical protein E05_35410 [Plautia stali symbiont]
MKLKDRLFELNSLLIVFILLFVCVGGGSEIIALAFRLPAEPMLSLGVLVFFALLIPVALRLHKLSKQRD